MFLKFFLFNLLGNVLPILTALVAVPVIAHYAGIERLGALGVVWALIGYFGFLDFGLSRVVTRRVALAVEQNRLGAELTELRGFLWWWAAPGLIVMTLLLIAARIGFARFLPSGWLGTELERSWIWVALCIPFALATNWLRGALEGVQRFVRVNLLRTVFGAWNYAAPALILLVSPTLNAMIAAITVGRLLALLGHAWACLQVEPGIIVGCAPRRLSSGRLFVQEGGWMTVSNLVGPLMVYSDRFVLAALLPATAVAWYVTSQEVMLRTLIIPTAMAGVLFPKFSGVTESSAHQTVLMLYQRSIRLISVIMLPLCTVAATLAYDALSLWLGEAFAFNSYRVVAIIAIGIFVYSIANVPFAWLQGVGRSDLTARIHLIELPVYAFGLYFWVERSGIAGAAWMWTIRVSADCLLLLAMASKDKRRSAISISALGASFIMLAGYLTGPGRDWPGRVGTAVIACLLSLLIAWYGILDREDRNWIERRIGALLHRNPGIDGLGK